MTRYVFVVLTNPREGQDDEFNEWYNNVHLHDVVQVPSFVAAQRFHLASTDPPQSFPQQYLALYEVETDDLEKTRLAMKAVAGTSAMVISPALDSARTAASYFRPITERVVAEDAEAASVTDEDVTLTLSQLQRAAGAIAAGFRDKSRAVVFPEDSRPRTIADGTLIRELTASSLGWRVIGWKIGAATERKRRENNNSPTIGRYYEGTILQSPVVMHKNEFRNALVEGEFAVRFDRSLSPREGGYSMDEVLDSIGDLMPAIEFAEYRAPNGKPEVVAEAIANGAGAFRLLLGGPIPNWREADIDGLRCHLALDGEVREREYFGADRTDPRWSAQYVVNKLGSQGIGIEAGQILSTGAILPYFPIGKAQHVEFAVEGCAPVRLEVRGRGSEGSRPA